MEVQAPMLSLYLGCCSILLVAAQQPLDNKLFTSTGFCPPAPHSNFSSYITRKDLRQHLAMIAALPYQPNTLQIRIHWLLDLVTVQNVTRDAVSYNYAQLDEVVSLFNTLELRLGFEFMGNPSNLFMDFENKTQLKQLYKLAYEIGSRYGNIAATADWNFETWNEPDHHDFDKLNFTKQGFLNYFDVTERGLHDGNQQIKFGGPGASCRLNDFSQLCWNLLWHASYGKNYFGGLGTRLDFISFHKKGSVHSAPPGSTSYQLEAEKNTTDLINKVFPLMRLLPIYNDEADPVKGWSKPMDFRADLRYPAMVLKAIARHVHSDDASISRIKMLSNDNAFLGYAPNYFTQRTLMALFIVNTTSPPEYILVKKPIYDLMTLLAFAQGHWTPLKTRSSSPNLLGYLASRNKHYMSLFVYASNDTELYDGPSLTFNITVPNVYISKPFVIYSMDNNNTMFDVWKSMGQPGNLTDQQICDLWSHQCLRIEQHAALKSNHITITLKPPSLMLINLILKCEDLKPPTDLKLDCIGRRKLLLTWKDDVITACFSSYEVEHKAINLSFVLMNEEIVVTRFYQFISTEDIRGQYRVRSKDTNGNRTPYSQTIYNPTNC